MGKQSKRQEETAKVYSFEDIVEFANRNAHHSAFVRGEPQSWAYWRKAADWASFAVSDPLLADPNRWPEAIEQIMPAVVEAAEEGDYQLAADLYSQAKWLWIMSNNNKWGIVKPNSLQWLRDFEAQRAGE